ncbi:hypothetical protein [Paramicrobacterium agarici]|uniref:Uncharacterized protein n=1 Tax=Paramicrobacterium agarici TaxID=630514 RepID=A0A2A9DZ57_9MICO|nr:hypothetical protein [Microbacterium agarici]PFG31884.1 hypothetical protein ATJ78_2866 [Microbacterium agarici]
MGIKTKLKRMAWAAAPANMVAGEEVQVLKQQVHDLRMEVEQLRRDLDEARRDSLRIAELTDLVVERLG